MATNISIDSIKAKQAAAKVAAEFVKDGMLIGLGTGSTASYFISSLIDRCHAGLKIKAIASSKKSQDQAKGGGIPIIEMSSFSKIDITFDGADEIDNKKRMIKGGGGALLREKILASSSQEMIVIVDESKLVKKLGRFPLAVEITPFGFQATIHKIQNCGYQGNIRKTTNNELYVSDNNNYIFDVIFTSPIDNPKQQHEVIKSIPGVVETGFFFDLAGRVIIGFFDGHVEIRS